MNSKAKLVLIACALGVVVGARASHAETGAECRTPRGATDSVFAWQQAAKYDPERATRCLEPSGRTRAQLIESAKHIKAVYDARALVVDMTKISDQPDFRNEHGQHAVVPHAGLPTVEVARGEDGAWRWTRASLDEIDATYAASFGTLENRVLDKLPAWMQADFGGLRLWQLFALFGILLVALVVRKVIEFVVKARVKNLVENLGQAWAAQLVGVFASPGATLVMALMLRVGYPRLKLPIFAASAVSITVRVLVVLSVVWAAYRLVDVLAERMASKAARTESKLDDQLVPLLRKALKVFTVVAGALFILQNLNINVGSLLAGLGIGGLAVALAAKDTLANFLGSLMIFLDRPFQIGDWVVVSGVEGIVEEVGFRSTRIRTFYNSLVSVPNARFMDANIDNYGRRTYRRTYVTLNLTYDTTPEQIQAFVEGIRAIIAANPKTRKDYYEVHMSAFGSHSLDVMVYFFFKVGSWTEELGERHNVFLEILRLAQDLGVSFAFPTQTLHVDSVAVPGEKAAVPEPLPEDRMVEIIQGFGPRGQLARPGGRCLTHGFLAGAAPAAD